MSRKRVAIACQGGGSQCAFVAGALRAFFAQGIHRRFEIVGLSGTSGGALTAALAWFGLLEQAKGSPTPVEDGIIAFWKDLAAQTPFEVFVDGLCIHLQRMVEHGLLPSLASSPSSPRFQLGSQALARLIARPEFTDLRALVVKHMNFDALPSLVVPESPMLLVGAADILQGNFKVLSSRRREISVDSLLASAAIPTLFPAASVDGHAYWDGIFSSNPPVLAFLQRAFLEGRPPPEEIWIIQVNRARHELIPETPSDILDRRNHLSGNLSLQHELQVIDMVNTLLREHALTDSFRARFGFASTESVTVRFIRMSGALQEGLDYASKLSREPTHIARLIADGEAQAGAFLAELAEPDQPEVLDGGGAPAEIH